MNHLPQPIELLSDNGSCYTTRDTRAFAHGIGLIPCMTPVSSTQFNGMCKPSFACPSEIHSRDSNA